MYDYSECTYPGHRKVRRGDVIHCMDCAALVAAGRMEPPEPPQPMLMATPKRRSLPQRRPECVYCGDPVAVHHLLR